VNRDQSHLLEHKRATLPIAQMTDDGTFSGYATLFGKVDLGRDRVERGAFLRSLLTRGKGSIRMLFQHDPAEPIGVWEEIREDEKGLYVRGRIVSQTARGQEVLNLMRAGAIDGLSIGFRTEKSRTESTSGIRSILQADLWEISIVTFPMLPQARVSQVKRLTPPPPSRLPTIRKFEHWLTQDAGLSRSEARVVINQGFKSLIAMRDAGSPELAELFEAVKRRDAAIPR